MSTKLLKAVAAMLNTIQRGNVLIGVEDSGEVCGVEREYAAANAQKPNWDGYSLALNNFLKEKLDESGAFEPGCYRIESEKIDEKTVAIIRTKWGKNVVWVNGELYMKNGNHTQKLKVSERQKFIKDRELKQAESS